MRKVLQLLLWNLADSKTTLDELRAQLPELEPPSMWIADAVTERSASSPSDGPPNWSGSSS